MHRIVYAFAALAFLGCSKDQKTSNNTTTTVASAPTAASVPGEVAEGKPAPQFKAKAHDGTDIDLAALKGKQVVLYFYPKDETSGCTAEAQAFRDSWTDLAKTGVVVIGV